MKFVDNFLNNITMYRLVLYGLTILAILAILFGFVGLLPYSGMNFIYSLCILLLVCFITNYLFAKLFNVHTNVESVWITAFILFFLLFPLSSLSEIKIFILVGVLAMASKYILTISKKHIFNPAAVSIFIVGLFGSGVASWWVGNSVLIIPVAILGFLILRKVQRFQLFFSFLAIGLISIFIFRFDQGLDVFELVKQVFLSEPILFFGTIMLTEPLTTPPKKSLRIIYGGLVGILYGAQFHIGPIFTTPELALVVGNIFSYLVSPRVRLVLTLLQKNKLSSDIYDFKFKLEKKFSFKPGQYLEWTLGHKNSDSRGNRRFFTIASSPTEENLHLGTKFYQNPSSFKKKLLSLEVNETILASQLAGEFTLPINTEQKLVWIAGGIGITPFRSMAKYLSDIGEKRNITLLYSNKTPQDIVYKDIFNEAEKIGLRTLYVGNDLAGADVTSNTRLGFIDAAMIAEEIPDYKERTFYISGPHGMVSVFEKTLKNMGLKDSSIKIDFFPGFV